MTSEISCMDKLGENPIIDRTTRHSQCPRTFPLSERSTRFFWVGLRAKISLAILFNSVGGNSMFDRVPKAARSRRSMFVSACAAACFCLIAAAVAVNIQAQASNSGTRMLRMPTVSCDADRVRVRPKYLDRTASGRHRETHHELSGAIVEPAFLARRTPHRIQRRIRRQSRRICRLG